MKGHCLGARMQCSVSWRFNFLNVLVTGDCISFSFFFICLYFRYSYWGPSIIQASQEVLWSFRSHCEYSQICSISNYYFFYESVWCQAKYTDPQTQLRYSLAEEFQTIRALPSDIVAGYLNLRKAANPVGWTTTRVQFISFYSRLTINILRYVRVTSIEVNTGDRKVQGNIRLALQAWSFSSIFLFFRAGSITGMSAARVLAQKQQIHWGVLPGNPGEVSASCWTCKEGNGTIDSSVRSCKLVFFSASPLFPRWNWWGWVDARNLAVVIDKQPGKCDDCEAVQWRHDEKCETSDREQAYKAQQHAQCWCHKYRNTQKERADASQAQPDGRPQQFHSTQQL